MTLRKNKFRDLSTGCVAKVGDMCYKLLVEIQDATGISLYNFPPSGILDNTKRVLDNVSFERFALECSLLGLDVQTIQDASALLQKCRYSIYDSARRVERMLLMKKVLDEGGFNAVKLVMRLPMLKMRSLVVNYEIKERTAAGAESHAEI